MVCPPPRGSRGFSESENVARAGKPYTRYFSENVVGDAFAVPPELLPALVALTQSLVFKSVHTLTFGYRRAALQKRDARWRERVAQARDAPRRRRSVAEAPALSLGDEALRPQSSPPPRT